MGKVQLIVGLYHFHSPVADREETKKLIRDVYKPLLKLIYNKGSLFFTLYSSASFLEACFKEAPQVEVAFKELSNAKRGKLEILGGSLEEPLLSFIQPIDRVKCIDAMVTFLNKHLALRPLGFWLPMDIWDPQMISALGAAGIKYSFLREEVFLKAGIPPSQLYSQVLTESQGSMLRIFPRCTTLSARMFRSSPEEILKDVSALAQESEAPPVISLFFPVQELSSRGNRGIQWLSEFVDLMEGASHWVESVLPRQVDKQSSCPLKLHHFSPSTYGEISGGDSQESYLALLTSHPEGCLLYGRLLHTKKMIKSLKIKTDRLLLEKKLWVAQNHHHFWSDGKPGLQNLALRQSAYSNILGVKKEIQSMKAKSTTGTVKVDMDMDGIEEHFYQGANIEACFHEIGGALISFDHLPSLYSYLNTLSSPQEDGGLKGKAFYDHLLEAPPEGQNIPQDRGDFQDAPYKVDKGRNGQHTLSFVREGCFVRGGKRYSVLIQKKYFMKVYSIEVEYTVINREKERVDMYFLPEVCLSLPGVLKGELSWSYSSKTGEEQIPLEGWTHDLRFPRSINLQDRMIKASLIMEYVDPPHRLTVFPLGGSGERGFAFLPSWELSLYFNESWTGKIILKPSKGLKG